MSCVIVEYYKHCSSVTSEHLFHPICLPANMLVTKGYLLPLCAHYIALGENGFELPAELRPPYMAFIVARIAA